MKFSILIVMLAKHLLYMFSILGIMGLSTCSDGNECNEFVCGSVVSKCLLTQSCQCKLSDCYCCKDCLNCLGELYTECCSCLDMCPVHNDTLSALAPKSQIGDFEGLPELFDTLTADDDNDQWSTVRFPMRNSLQRHFNMATGNFGFGFGSPLSDVNNANAFGHKPGLDSINCTVIYLNICTNNKKCLQYCESMVSKIKIKSKSKNIIFFN